MSTRRCAVAAMGYSLGLAASVLAVSGIVALGGTVAVTAENTPLNAVQPNALSPLPPPASLNPGKVLLGERLFHDPVLSGEGRLSCSTCHNLKTGGTVRVPRTIGYKGKVHAFNAPTIFNVGTNYRLGWRGRFTSLSVQNEAVLDDPNLMAADRSTVLSRLRQDETYLSAFRQRYGALPSRENVLDALVTFQMSLATPNAPFDRFLNGDQAALAPAARHGLKLFMDYGCVSCHQGANVGGNMFQIFGVFGPPDAEVLQTRSDLDKRLSVPDGDADVFRVPSLRNVEVTAPYFHDGSVATLRKAIAVMGRSQLGRQLSPNDIADLEAFLKSLTGEYDGKRLTTVVTQPAR
jgi:cytochrome c peroxidase